MAYTCPKCGNLIRGKSNSLIRHLRLVHAVLKGRIFTETIMCSQNGCERTFSSSTKNFTRHLEREHDEGQYDDATANYQGDNEDEVHVDGELSDDSDSDHDIPEDEIWDNFGEEEVKEKVSMLIASLLGSSSIPQSTVTSIVQNAASLFNDVSSYTSYRIKRFAHEAGIHEDDDNFKALLTDLATVSCPFKEVDTSYKQRKFFVNSDGFVEPHELPLGAGYFPCNNPLTGNVQQVRKQVTFQYVPIKNLLKMVLEHTDLLSIAAKYSPSTDDLMRDLHDGEHCKGSEFLSSPSTIRLIVYIDDFEVTNPLSPKAGIHKLGAVYCTISNVPPQYRSTLSNILLVMLFNSGDAKLYGYSAVFKQFITDLKSLEAEGIHIHTPDFNGVVHVAVGQFVGDNLGIHSLFGYAEGFTANYPCRSCRMNRTLVWKALKEEKRIMRNKENYEQDLALDNLQETGIKSPCCLNELTHFHVTSNRAPDIMHDMLEGVCPLELKLILNELLKKGCFTLEDLNGRITSFNYGQPDKRNKPCIYGVNQLRSPDGAAGQHAGQMWCLMRHIALMIGDTVPEGDDHWELLLALLECMDIIFSPVVSKGDTVYLAHLIHDHHSLFLELFPDRHLKPKHHFMLHYPSAMQFIGPLINLWVMRFEAKHNFARRLSHIVCNFRNIAKTLAYRNQMQLCYGVLSKQTLAERDLEVGPGSTLIVASIDHPYAEAVVQSLQVPLYDEVYVAKWCKVFGTEYHANLTVVIGKKDGNPLFGKIRMVIPYSSSVNLLCELWHTVGFNRHKHAYALLPVQPEEISVVKVKDLVDFYPLHATKSYVKTDPNFYVCMRHTV